jgi:hypothetical protein
MSNYIGFYCLGAVSQEEATAQQGLCIWMVKKPSLLKRSILTLLLGAFWIDRIKPKTIKPKS